MQFSTITFEIKAALLLAMGTAIRYLDKSQIIVIAYWFPFSVNGKGPMVSIIIVLNKM